MLALGALVLAPGASHAHAFPDRSEPRVGRTVDTPPSQVRIWFDGEIEPHFSTIRVENADRQQVDRGDSHVDPNDNTLLAVSLRPALPPGKYRVVWSVVARDGHRTEGDFSFRVK
jgi:methionine-rich copper-binding protein CopC